MDIYSRYAPFVQEFIYRNGWESLRGVQVAAADVIFNSDDNLLLSASTASGKTEAAAMNGILKERGVPEGKMLLEDKAKTTGQNFANAAKIADPSRPVVVITNDYHMERAVSTAKKAGFMDIQRMPARSTALNYPANVIWEVIMMINELTLKRK